MVVKLTLSQRAQYANDSLFLKRLVAAVKETARYWKDYSFSQLSDYNEAVRKRKEFASKILNNSSVGNIQAYAEYFLNAYTYDNEADPLEILSDHDLTESSATSLTFDTFAGIKQGDEQRQIIF